MIKGLSDVGLRNVLDVVYNHTNSSGQNDKSTFDKIVPGYYFRLSADGSVTTSTCCQNTATEHAMMYKFTRDSILFWVKHFKIDGFRFDLMGHMPKALLVDIRADLDKLTVANDGVDGESIILYGEGWNFGEVQNGARFIQAIQGNMAGTGIAVFDDRLRDSAKGGGPFDNNPTLQGFASSSWSTQKIDGKKMKAIIWNGDPDGRDGIARTLQVLSKMDVVKLGLIGTLQDYGFRGADGFKTSGTLLRYNGAPAGYNLHPTDMIAYVDKHDNEALFDWLAYKLPQNTSLDARLRHQVLALSISTLGQGVPFYQAGTDIMRSKSLDKNSYNSGDWFNAIRWDMSDNGFGRGLPMKGDNGARWDAYAKPLLAQSSAIKPTSEQMLASTKRFQEFLQIRYSSELFRLSTGDDVRKRIRFANTSGKTPGVIAMTIADGSSKFKKLPDLDPNLRAITVVFNTNVKATKVTIGKLGKVSLHPIQQNSVDAKLKGYKVVSQKKKSITVLVPALSTLVLTQK
jgi:pullulanase-type alpha-1,6-glucosidase